MRSPHLKPRALVFFGLYVCAIAYLSLYPWQLSTNPGSYSLVWEPVVGRRQILDTVLNVFFYVPLGASLVLAVRPRKLGWILAVLAGCGLSFLIESLQLRALYRHGTWNDFTTNSLGTIAGATAAYVVARSQGRSRRLAKSTARKAISLWSLQPTQTMFLILWILWQAFPFIPAIALSRLTQPTVTWSWRTGAEVFLGFTALRAVVGNSPWLLIACAILPAQAFLVDRSLSVTALIGALLGYFAARLVDSRMPAALAFALPVWLAYEEFRPFQFVREPQPFTWAPFDSWFAVVADSSYYPIIFWKLYIYTATVWSLRASGWRWLFAVGLPALILSSGEWAQVYLPGRTPETTDVVVLGIGAVLLAICSGKKRTAEHSS